ncbi:MAG: glycosyltransferase, partial [Candidatus Binatia bacterium]
VYRVFAFRTGHLAAWSYLVSSLFWMARNRHKFQLIHTHSSSSGLVGGLIGFMLRKKVVCKLARGDEVDAKGLRTTLLGRIKLYCLKHTLDRFVAITNGIEEELKDLGIPSRKVVRIPNGINLDGFSKSYDREQIKSEIGWTSETKIVTFVGRLVLDKGVDWLLEVWKEVAQRRREGRLLIVGDGPERSALEAQARALGITETVAIVGRQEDVYRFLAITDIFVLPSRQEGVANALLEAMSQGIPVVVADDRLGGSREVVDDQKDGYVVRLGDTATFAEIVSILLQDPGLRKQIGRKARQKIEEKFSIKSVADRHCKIYDELVGIPGELTYVNPIQTSSEREQSEVSGR